MSTDMSSDTEADGRWLTYPELATARGIDKPSALRLVSRKGWRRRKNNQGHMQILVPFGEIKSRDMSMDSATPAPTNDVAAMAAVTALWEKALDVIRGEIAAERGRADRAEAALAGSRQEIDALRERLDAADTRARDEPARTATAVTTALREAAAARKAMGRLARLRAAWRGE